MNPVKCPNCRLSLPQNWAGMNDPNAKCPYCGKGLAGQPTPPSGAPPTSPVAPPPAVARPAKTILWGVGGPIPGSAPKSAPDLSPQPVPAAMNTAAREVLANSATQNREMVAEPVFSAPTEPRAALEGADIDVDLNEPANPVPAGPSIQAASKPAATVMFESGMAPAAGPLARMERPEPPPAVSETSEEMEEPEPPAPASPRPTPTKSRLKSKPLPKKGGKTGKPAKWSTAEDKDEVEEPKSSSSKAPMIVAITVAVAALIGAGVYFLRGKSEPSTKEAAKTAEPAPAQAEPTPSEEPAALAPKPVPSAKPAPAEKPAPTEKPTRAEKPAHAEKPAATEKPKAEPAATEPKVAGGKQNEEDYRQANEAYERGNAKLFQGNTAEAIAEFSHALKLNPKDPAIHRGLGLAYAQSGKSAEAIKHLKLYVKAAPKATDRAIIEKRIDQLHGH
jgi:hypothetical protein